MAYKWGLLPLTNWGDPPSTQKPILPRVLKLSSTKLSSKNCESLITQLQQGINKDCLQFSYQHNSNHNRLKIKPFSEILLEGETNILLEQ